MFSGWTPRYGGSSGYPPPPPPPEPGLQSFRDQHRAQLEQLQRMHQRQMESVLPVGSPAPPRPLYPPRQAYPYPPPYGHHVPPPGYQTPAVVPPDTDLHAAMAQPPPPPPPEDAPPGEAESMETGITLTEDPEQAQRLKTLQEAAAHWQQHELHRVGFQYQGIMQRHSTMQQLLQRYQQIVQEPPHLAAMTVDVQIQHYEMQQKQMLPLHQEWEAQFKKWQELLQTYPHKDQLQDYQVQWATWQTHLKATKTNIKEKISSLKSLKQQYGGSHYIGGIAMVHQYPAYSPVISPAVPAALPAGMSLQPTYATPLAPVYGAAPPPTLPPAPTYSETMPPLPPVTAPPLPPTTSAPPPPPPASSPSADVIQPPPPLPPDTQPPPPVASSTVPEPQTMSYISTPAPSSSTGPSTTTTISSSAASSFPSAMPPAGNDPAISAASLFPENKNLTSGPSYQSQHALQGSIPILGLSASAATSNNPPSNIPPSGLDRQNEDSKLLNPPGPPPVPGMTPGGQYAAPTEPRFAAQGHGFTPPLFPPGSHGFHGSHSMPDRESKPWTNEQKDKPTPADTSKQYLEASDRKVSTNRWDRPTPDQPWDRPRQPPVSATPKETSDYQPGPFPDREPTHQGDSWNRPDGPPFDRRGNQGENMRNKWDEPPDAKWGSSKEPSKDRWQSSQDRWRAENTSSPAARFGDAPNSGANRFGGPGDGKGPQYDQHAASEGPFRNKFGQPDGSPFRYNTPDLQSRGRGGFSAMPPQGRFPFSESHPRQRFGVPESRPPSFGYPEAVSRDRFGGPEPPSSQDHMGGQEQPAIRDHFGGPERPTKEHFGGSEQSPLQENFGNSGHPNIPHQPFRGPDRSTPHDRFGGPELPHVHDRFGGPNVPYRLKGPEMPPPPGESFKGSGTAPPSGDRFKGTDAFPPLGDRFKGPDAFPPPGDRSKGPDVPPPPGDRSKGPNAPPPPGDRSKCPDATPPPGDRSKGPDATLPPGDRSKGPDATLPPGDRSKGPDATLPPGDRSKGLDAPLFPGVRSKGPDASLFPGDGSKGPDAPLFPGDGPEGPDAPLFPRDGSKGPDAPLLPGDSSKGPDAPFLPGDSSKGPDAPLLPGDRFRGPDAPLLPGDRFRGSEAPLLPGDRFRGSEAPLLPGDRFRGPDVTLLPGDRFRGPDAPPHPGDRFRGPDAPPHLGDRFRGPDAPPHLGDRFRGPDDSFPPGDRFRGPDDSFPPGDRFRGPEAPSHLGDRFRGPEAPSHLGDRFRGPDAPTHPGDRFRGPDAPSHPGDRFRGPDAPPHPGDRFRGPDAPPHPGDRFRGPDAPPHPGDRFRGPDVPLIPGNRFRGPDAPHLSGDRLGGPDTQPPPGDRFRGPDAPLLPGNRFRGPDVPSSQQSRLRDFESPLQDNRSHGDDENSFNAAEVPLRDSQDNSVPSSDRWGAGDQKGRPEWPRGRGDGGKRPALLGVSPLEKPEIPVKTETVPVKSYQSQFNRKPLLKATNVPLSASSISGGLSDSKPDQKDIEMKPVEKPSNESTLQKAESPVVKAALKKETLGSSDQQKASKTAGPDKDKPEALDLPKTAPKEEQTLPVPSKVKEPESTSLAPSDASKDPGQIKNTSTSKSEESLPGLSKSSVPQVLASVGAKSDTPVSTLPTASKPEKPTDSPAPLIKPKSGLLPTPTTAPPFRPQTPQAFPLMRPGAPPVRPGGPRLAPPVRPGGPRGPPLVRPGGPRGAPPVRPGGPMVAHPGGPRAPPPVRFGGPRAPHPVRLGGPRAPPPGGPRAAFPVRLGGPRAGYPVRPGAPFSSWEEPDQGFDRNIYADPMCEDPYDEDEEEFTEEEHDPESHYNRPEFYEDDEEGADNFFHHEPGRPGGFIDDASFEPEPYAQDWPENYEMRFDQRGRGRARGFIRGRLPPRPGSHETMDVLDERGFEARGHLPDERPFFREGLNEPPPFGREPFPRESRFSDRERFPLEPTEARRREFDMGEERLDDWERERLWRAREQDRLNDPLMDPHMRDERQLLRPPHPHDIDVRRDPRHDQYLDKDLDRGMNSNRLERPYLFERDIDRDYPNMREDLDLPLRERDWLPPRRPLSPHRPYSPVRALSPLPPLPPIDRYLDDRWRLERDLDDIDFRDRGELRVREYPERPLWHEGRNPDLLHERTERDPKDGRWYPPEERAAEGLNAPSLPVDSGPAAAPEQSLLPGGEPGTPGVLALSQRQHEIILKAAQELKMLREQKEQLDTLKNFFGDPEPSGTSGKLASDLQSGGDLQPPPNAPASSTSAAPGRSGDPFSGGWEGERRGGHPMGSKLSGIQQTVDYAHGRDLPIGKVEQTPYGERVVLLPDPLLDRGGMHPYQKDYLIDSFDRDFRDQDPYFERMKSADRRDYEWDRSDTQRDRADHERDRDRHSRDDRSSYRDKESSSRRSTSDKPSYDRDGKRPGYEGPPSSYGGSRRGYPDERPGGPPPLPVPPPEKKPETKNVDDLLKRPGRDSRPDRIVVIMRGLPGSGKTHVAKLIRDKEVENGGSAPRVLSLDDYFITEVEKVEKDPESGKKVKRKVMEYEYEPEMEETYRSGMLKAFKKTLDDGFFPFIILDSIHDRVRHFEQFWSAAKTKGFEVYLAEITADTQTCGKRNVHSRKLKDINKMADNWEPAPRHMIRLDIRSLLQDAAIDEVEMEDSEPSVEPQKDEKKDAADEEDNDRGYLPKSKWEMDTSEAKLDKLDGLKVNKRKRDYESIAGRMEDYLQLPDDYDTRESEPGKKRVRWADLEEKKDADRKRAIGFVVGQTDWEKITDKSGHLAQRALNRTKYI